MRIHTTNLMNNAVTRMAIITVFCCLITYRIAGVGEHCGLAFVGFAALLLDAIVFIGWIMMATYVIWSRRKLPPMNPNAGRLLDLIGLVTFVYWLAISGIPALIVGAWIIPLVWIAWCVSLYIALKVK